LKNIHLPVYNEFTSCSDQKDIITKNKDDLLIPTSACPKQLLDDIMTYFLERNEDEGFR
jgi:hypothetical protein